MRFHVTPVRKFIIKNKQKIVSAGEDVEKLEPYTLLVKIQIGIAYGEIWRFLKVGITAKMVED